MTETNHRFMLRLPEGWDDMTAHTFMGPEVNGQRHILNLVIDRQLIDHDLKEFALDRIQPIKESLPDIETLKEEERTLAGGTKAYEWVYKWVPTDGKAVFKKHVYLIIGDRGYTFTASFTKQSFKTIGVEVDNMIQSFVPET
jgi:hypothetical protein